MVPVSWAMRCTSLAGTYRNSGSWSIKRAMSQGQAIRSILGRSRVTHFMALSPLETQSGLRGDDADHSRISCQDTSVAFHQQRPNMETVSTHEDRTVATAQRWLLLTQQLPAKPAYARVKVWRRLQAIGAVSIKNGVYALP